MGRIHSLKLGNEAKVEQKQGRKEGLASNAKAVRLRQSNTDNTVWFPTSVEGRLLSLQPDLHNVQRSDCKQMHTSNHNQAEAAKKVQIEIKQKGEKKKHSVKTLRLLFALLL